MKVTSVSPSCVDKLKLLADPTRLAVLEVLMIAPKHVNELIEELGVEQSLLSHHLALLRDGGLVESIRDGKGVLYQLAKGVSGTSTKKAIHLGCCTLSFS